MSKRGGSPPPEGVLIKRARSSTPPTTQLAISSSGDDRQKGLIRTVKRTSSLEAPIISLAGAHSGEIMSCRFDPSGQNIAACSADRSLSLWKTYPPNTNYGLISSLTKAPILDLQWSLFSPTIYSVGADHTLCITDVTTGQRVRRIRAHREIINSLDRTMASGSGTELLATGSDDGSVKIWEADDDGVAKVPISSFEIGCPVTAVAWSADAQNLYIGALDNEIHVYDIRKGQEVYSLGGHTDTPTSLSVSPNGSYLLSPSLSSQTIIHDVRPFSPSPSRVHRVLLGAPAGFENTLLRAAWSRDDGGQRVAVGGADRMVTIWEVESSKILYKLPGHKGTVTSVDFHPKEPISSKDGTMLLGEIEHSKSRTLDVTCCDIEPGVVARNILLLSLIQEEDVDVKNLWCIFYHLYIDEGALSLVVSQSRKLAEASKDLQAWRSSPFWSYLKLCTADTCSELHKFWLKYAELGSRGPKDQAAAKRRFASEMKKQRKLEVFDTTMRTAGIWFIELMSLGMQHFKSFWDTGLTTIGSAASATFVNPTYAFTGAGERCNIHHGTDPILGFHLAPVLAPLKGLTGDLPNPSTITLADIDQCAFNEFQAWCKAFKDAKSRTIVRFFIGEALSFCYALHAKKEGINLMTSAYKSPWTSQCIPLVSMDYNVVGDAPALFNVIDTSNLADHLGMLNVLLATVPLLEESAVSSLITDTLLPAGATSKGSLEYRLCGDIGTMSLLLGISSTAYSSGFSTTSMVNEYLFNSASTVGEQVHRETFEWKLCSAAYGEKVTRPSFDPAQLAQFLHQVFLKMFIAEGTEHLRGGVQLDRLLGEMTLKHYTRKSFAMLLRSIRGRIATNWDSFMNLLMDKIQNERSLVLGTNFFQDLYVWLHLTGVFDYDTLQTDQDTCPPQDQDLGRFRGWQDIPGVVCVLLVVPRNRLRVLTDIPPEEIGTPVLQVDLKLSYAHNMFASFQICFGKCRVVENEVYPGEPLVEIDEDAKGIQGSSDAIVSVWLPTWILRQEVKNTKIGLSVHPSPIASRRLVPKLGVFLSLYETNLMDTERIHVLRWRPGIYEELNLISKTPASIKGFKAAQEANAKLNIVELHPGSQGISLLKSRIDITEPEARKSLLDGASVGVVQTSQSTLKVEYGTFAFEADFELPVDGPNAKLRIARKSSYIEVLASPTQPDLPKNRFFDPAPILTRKSPVLQFVHYLDLDRLPSLDTNHGPSRLSLLRAHMAATFSERERLARDQQPQEQRDVICNVKDTIASLLLIASNVQDVKSKIFALDMPSDIGIYTLIFVEELRIDLPSNTVVADAYILPLTPGVMSNIYEELQEISAGRQAIRIATFKEEMVAWKRLLPAFAERARRWRHLPQCEYVQAGKIPLTTEPAENPICSCGAGNDLGDFAERTKWKRLTPFVTRAAISPLYAPGFLEEIGSPLGADFRECGIQLELGAGDGDIEVDGRGIPTVELEKKHDNDEAKSDARREGKKKQPPIPEARPQTTTRVSGKPAQSSAHQWWQEWEEVEYLRSTVVEPTSTPQDRMNKAFRFYIGVLHDDSEPRFPGRGPLNKDSDFDAPGNGDDDDIMSDEEEYADQGPTVHNTKCPEPEREEKPPRIRHDFDVLKDLPKPTLSLEEKMLAFLADPERGTKVFLSSYMRARGIMW
ncbi:hypothetical protein ONZ45_g11536 [Pleurotus djamor]|nr:hypothetical protein ONZ45_g11536 [Pleurotus djamor]